MPPLVPASLTFRDDGTPWSEIYGDVYHSAAGGLGQARHVFIRGNDLPARWRGRHRFCVVETGFGLGLNFLATWAAWRDDPARCERLHYVSFELHPFKREDLQRALGAWPELAPLANELVAHWPPLTPGFHRLELDDGRIVLSLLFGDALDLLPQLECRADAFFLDGFSPAQNPDLWKATLLGELSRLAAPGATLATWSSSGAVRRTLEAAGFSCRKVRGFASKLEMLECHYTTLPLEAREPQSDRHAVVVGAGLAGTSIAHRLAERGWTIDVIESADAPGQGASGNRAGVMRPLPSIDDNRLARITRAASFYALRHLERLSASGLPVRWDACGVLHLARDVRQEHKMREVVQAHDYPETYLQYVDRAQASGLARWPLSNGGWWFPEGAWVNPPSLCEANLAAFPERIRIRCGHTLDRLEPVAGGWRALDANQAEIANAPIVILANGVGISRIPEAGPLPVRSARGQVTHLGATEGGGPAVIVCRSGYVSPAIDGIRSVGATFSMNDDEPDLRERDHIENLEKLEGMLPGLRGELAPGDPGGRVGFRPASPDRLPMVGAVPCASQTAALTKITEVIRQPGLYAISGFGARGLVWSAIAAELLASQLDGDPLPLERELVEAMDPARYLLRPLRRGRKG